MLVEVWFVIESLVALVARKSIYTSVDREMVVVTFPGLKRFSTIIAVKLQTFVSSHVVFVVRLVGKPFPTLIAVIFVMSCVEQHVSVQTGSRLALCAALCARVTIALVPIRRLLGLGRLKAHIIHATSQLLNTSVRNLEHVRLNKFTFAKVSCWGRV